MIDLKSIFEESKWNSSRGFGYQKSKLTFDEVLVILHRLAKAEVDAKRYRFMRDMSDKVDVSHFFCIDVSERDAEIDGVMNHEAS
ncbi:hypothetical protein [Aeromonas hydrophila]|uniref:hypothetical protein n=1 Tax=Aeromonas hydrophila TaxID=644 RepID=UPI0023623F31|nr:hypothetical protein [Aeromonas hydrophila]